MQTIYQGALMGIIATIAMDITSLILKRVPGLPSADWALIGRWLGHIPKGVFIQESIADAEEIRHERLIGWTAHYLTGIVYGLTYLGFIQVVLLAEPSISSALAFGLVTLVAPWCIMQPGLGLGIFATKAPRPWMLRSINVTMHVIFGTGLYAGWLLV